MLFDTTGIIFNGNNAVEMIDADVFNENFHTHVDIKFSDLEDNWKTNSGITVAEGRIRLRPITKVNIRAFFHWAREKIRQDEDPSLNLFPFSDRDDIIERLNTHKKWLGDATNMVNNSMTKNFT